MDVMKVFPEFFVWTEIFGKSIINSPCLNIHWYKSLSKTDNNTKKHLLNESLENQAGRQPNLWGHVSGVRG